MPDLLRLGVLLLGVSALIVALVALHAYYTNYTKIANRENFYAYCDLNTVIIHANEELRDVRVLKPEGDTICNFSRITRGSDDVCRVPSEGIYIVQVGDFKRAVTCGKAPIRPIPPVPGD